MPIPSNVSKVHKLMTLIGKYRRDRIRIQIIITIPKPRERMTAIYDWLEQVCSVGTLSQGQGP